MSVLRYLENNLQKIHSIRYSLRDERKNFFATIDLFDSFSIK